MPLKNILDQIALMHDAKFSYIDEELLVYAIIPPEKNISLSAKLRYIEKLTKLKFQSAANNYYTVYNERKMDKPLCAYLLDVETGIGIENAQVFISGTSIGSTSNEQGYFELPVIGPNKIEIRHLGYMPKTIDPQDLYVSDCGKISLHPIVEELGEVVTVHYLTTGITRTKSGELIIKPQKFGILPGLTEPDVLQAMQQIPGIVSVDENVSNINVRGGTHDQNLFLWNGIRMFQTGHFFGLISAINPYLASKISISRNGSSAFYGESVSSLVDISTHTSVSDSCYHLASVDMLNANFLSKFRLTPKATLQLSGRRTYSDLFISPTFKNYKDRIFQNTIVTDLSNSEEILVNSDEEFYFYDFSAQYMQKLGNRHTLAVDAIGVENNADILQQTAIARNNSSLKQRNFGGSINWTTQWNALNHSEFTTSLSYYDMASKNDAVETNQLTWQRNTVFDKAFSLKHIYSFRKTLKGHLGYQFDEISVTNSDQVNEPFFYRVNKEVSRSHVVIAETEYQSEYNKTFLRTGLRMNYFEKFTKVIVEPRITFSQAIFTGLRLELMAEQKSQTLSQLTDRQQDFLGIEKRRWVLSDEENIPIQLSTQFSIGFNYSKKGWIVTLENYFKQVDGITSQQQGFQNQFEFTASVGSYRVLGSELLLQKNFSKFNTWISYTFNDNQYEFTDFTPNTFANNFEIRHAVVWAGSYDWKNLRIAIGTRWHTGKPVTPPSQINIDEANTNNSQIVYNKPNNQNLPDYFQANLSASKTWSLGKRTSFTASGSLLNIFGRRNIINQQYRINNSTNTVESVNTYSLARTPNISLKIVY